MSLREIRGIRVEELDLSKPILNMSRRSLARKDYSAIHHYKDMKLGETTPVKIKEEDKEETLLPRKSKRMRRPSMWLANDDEADTQSDKYHCTYCGLVVPSLSYLNNHMLVHTGLRGSTPPASKQQQLCKRELFPCHLCCRSFRKQGSLELHLKNIHQTQNFKCEMCNRCFYSKHSLLMHWQGKICPFFNIDD